MLQVAYLFCYIVIYHQGLGSLRPDRWDILGKNARVEEWAVTKIERQGTSSNLSVFVSNKEV